MEPPQELGVANGPASSTSTPVPMGGNETGRGTRGTERATESISSKAEEERPRIRALEVVAVSIIP